ncbi:MAG: pyrimidine/purine nucleoside phosphorylase [Candidatus Delongbacteria bacterium]|nr:pyrimidine/purine nucleoside phosphorylase [Candidatus Delongbacteria bacterium]
MFDTNEYFDGKVKSIAYETAEGPATIGVMAPGDYEFGTSKKEFMTVVSGKLVVLLPNEDDWKEFGPNETFIVEANVKFKVKVKANTSYICLYR